MQNLHNTKREAKENPDIKCSEYSQGKKMNFENRLGDYLHVLLYKHKCYIEFLATYIEFLARI
jgi:hypothetical protein